MRYWNKIEDSLRDLGCVVETARVGTVSSLRTRAKQLNQFVGKKLGGENINFIAHSMVYYLYLGWARLSLRYIALTRI